MVSPTIVKASGEPRRCRSFCQLTIEVKMQGSLLDDLKAQTTPAVDSTAPAPQGQPETNQPEVNAPKDRAKFMRRVTSLGEQEGHGANARPALAIQIVEAAHFGALSSAGDDAKMLYEAYARGAAKARGVSEVKLGSATQQASKLATFIRLGELTSVDGRETISKLASAIKAARESNGGKPLGKSAMDAMLSGARYQLQYPDELISDDMVKVAIYPSPVQDKLEVDKLGVIYSSMERLHDNNETPCSADTRDMLQEVMTEVMSRIVAMGGTTAMKKEAEKADKKKAAKAAKDAEEIATLEARVRALQTR